MIERGNLDLAENRQPRFFYGYIVALAAFFIMTITWGAAYSFGVFFKPVLAEFGWTRAMTSAAFSLYMLMHGFFSIVTGRLNDRVGPRVLMTVCGFLLGLGYLLMSRISAIWQLYLFYGMIIGIGVSGSYVPLVSTVARWFVKRRGLMTGLIVSGIGLGTIIVPPIASRLIATYDWRISYVIVGTTALVLLMIAAQFLKRDPGQIGQLPYGADEVKQESLKLEARGLSLQQAIHTRQFWLLFILLFCFGFGLQTVMVHIVPHATDLRISAATAANILAIIGGLSIAGRVIMGSVADRIGNKLALTISFILMLVALSWLLAAKEVWMLYLFAVVFGFGYGGMVVAESPIVAELFGLSSHGVILGIVSFAWTIGSAIGPVMAGHIFDTAKSYQPAFLVCAILSAIGIVLAILLTPLAQKEETNDSRRGG